MKQYSELINTEEVDGFEIRFYAEEEDLNPADSFDLPEEDMQELFRKLDAGLLVWFCAKVTASKGGIELGTDYLGGCCYESAEQFCNEYKEDYYRDMVNSAIAEARETIKKINS